MYIRAPTTGLIKQPCKPVKRRATYEKHQQCTYIRRQEIRTKIPYSQGVGKSVGHRYESVAMASNQCEFQSEAEEAY